VTEGSYVSWIRRSDLKILTIGETLYTKDKRFAPLHEDGSAVWILKLTHPEPQDSGDYECQVSYHDEVEKKLTIPFQLTVLDSRAHIQDSPDMHVQIGSRIVLTCHVRASSGPPDYVFWYRGSDVLNYSPLVKIEDFYKRDQETTTVASSRGGDNADPNDNFIFDTVQFSKDAPVPTPNLLDQSREDLISRLSVDDAVSEKDSGNYTCAPSNARSTSIMVHVHDDESGPAAMQHGNSATASPIHHHIKLLINFFVVNSLTIFIIAKWLS